MGTWDKNFSDVMQQFEWRRGQLAPVQPKANVVLFIGKKSKYILPMSKFCDVKFFPLPIQKSFAKIALKEIKEASASPLPFHVILPLPGEKPAEVAEQEPKKRTTLRLNKKVELPPLELISNVETEKRRHPLSNKSWSELLAAVETPKKNKWNIDLASAFKTEMKAFEAEQAKAVEQGISIVTPMPAPQPRSFLLKKTLVA